MTHPFESPEAGPHHEGFGFGAFDPHSRRAMHQARREARREMKDFLKGQALARAGGFGGGPFGAAPGFGSGFGFGPGGPRGGHRGRGRGRRGDVRAAILALLAERPMHGYEMIQEIGQRSNGLWRPSPGSVYPTLQLLVDEGLIVGAESDGSKRLFELTDGGREAAATIQTPPWDAIAEGADPNTLNLRDAFGQLAAAVLQSSHAATPDQQKRILDIVNNARRDIYGVLGEAE
ncbi:MAG: helix-turn-helix transcriptional regulator [Mycobacteriaceae bacterium]|nr:helix-turn-helix transcriptional regulator [Mycobacteriaceae bacterium]